VEEVNEVNFKRRIKNMPGKLLEYFQNLGMLFEAKHEDFEKRIARLEQAAGLLPLKSSAVSDSEAPEEKKEDCFYFLSVAGTTFSKPSKEREDYSIYRFVKTAEENKFLVYIENTPQAVQKFAGNPKTHENACDSENLCPSNPSGIETVEPGVAFFDGSKYNLKTRVKIKYLG